MSGMARYGGDSIGTVNDKGRQLKLVPRSDQAFGALLKRERRQRVAPAVFLAAKRFAAAQDCSEAKTSSNPKREYAGLGFFLSTSKLVGS
jgi:hypothetical protein